MSNLAYIVRDSHIPYITKDAKHILDHLASREGENDESWPSTRTLSECTNISLKGVQRAINCLIANELIVRTSGKQSGSANHYKVTLPQFYADAWRKDAKKGKRVRQHDLPTVGHAVPPRRPSDAAGVGQGDAQREKVTCEEKSTQTQNKVSESVRSSSQSPVAKRLTLPSKGNRAAVGNEVIERDEKGAPVICRLAEGRYTVDRTYGAYTCWRTGCSNEEAHKFWRYNQSRGWPLLASGMSLLDIALRWRDTWSAMDPEGYRYERERRQSAERRKQEQRLMAAAAADQ